MANAVMYCCCCPTTTTTIERVESGGGGVSVRGAAEEPPGRAAHLLVSSIASSDVLVQRYCSDRFHVRSDLFFFNSSTVLDRRAPSQYATSCDMIGSQPNRSKAIRAALYVYGNNAMVRYERNASKGACTTTLPVLWKTKQELAKFRSYSLLLDTEASGRPTDNRHNKTQDWRSRILSRTQ